MCQATALFINLNIHIVGTANKNGFTKLDAKDLYVGYYQDQHYQRLEQKHTGLKDLLRNKFGVFSKSSEI